MNVRIPHTSHIQDCIGWCKWPYNDIQCIKLYTYTYKHIKTYYVLSNLPLQKALSGQFCLTSPYFVRSTCINTMFSVASFLYVAQCYPSKDYVFLSFVTIAPCMVTLFLVCSCCCSGQYGWNKCDDWRREKAIALHYPELLENNVERKKWSWVSFVQFFRHSWENYW